MNRLEKSSTLHDICDTYNPENVVKGNICFMKNASPSNC
jgi:hypothetical protein